MINIKFNKKQSYDELNSKKWVLGNGLGGYAAQSVINSIYRKQDGYLVASNQNLTKRMMILNTITEKVDFLNQDEIETSCYYKGFLLVDNSKYLDSFNFSYLPTYNYIVHGLNYQKTIALEYLKNTVVIKYHFKSIVDCKVLITPHFNYRFSWDKSNMDDLTYPYDIYTDSVILHPFKDTDIKFYFNDGVITNNEDKVFGPVKADYDFTNGDSSFDYHYVPFNLMVDLSKDTEKEIKIVVSIENNPTKDVDKVIKNSSKRYKDLVKNANLNDEYADRLVLNADCFIVNKTSKGLKTILAGLPWFTDWGRDTMISFTGLLLVTKRYEEAKDVLLSFGKFEKEGLIPNGLQDEQMLYNTVDTSLWYFYACYKYYEYTSDLDCIKTLMPVLKDIIIYYKKGTKFNIKMNEDGLISVGTNDDHVTWMDAVVNNKAVTPRHGKPVEINALWYNGLKTYEFFCNLLAMENEYKDLDKLVKISFNKRFYNPQLNCLFDVVDELETAKDDLSVRPNQLIMFSLPFIVLDETYQKQVVDTCYQQLYNVYGMRSLSKLDPRFKGVYEGDKKKRNEAYHMGTTWCFLLGSFIDAYNHVYHDIKKIKEFLFNFKQHLNEGCLNGVCEVLNGDVPGPSRGCYTHACGVGEILRTYYENILRIK